MYIRNRIEIDVPENSREPEKILILAPAASCEAEDLGGQLVFALRVNEFRELEFGWREAVLRIADIVPVQPQSETALRSLEGYKDPFSLHKGGKIKVLHIAGNGIKTLRNFARANVFITVPGILYICILRMSVPLHLDMGRDSDHIPFSRI